MIVRRPLSELWRAAAAFGVPLLPWVIFALAAAYGVAKVAEVYDRAIFELGGWVSGHTLKHLAAAAGVFLLLRALQQRVRR